jgi:hypothetical protein
MALFMFIRDSLHVLCLYMPDDAQEAELRSRNPIWTAMADENGLLASWRS